MKTVEDIKNHIKTSTAYDFLRDKSLNPLLVCLGGSNAYGTEKHDEDGNITSDIDIRGIIMQPESSIFSIAPAEVFELRDNKDGEDIDAVLYPILKMIELLSECNPNVLEILDSSRRNVIMSSDSGEMLIDNAEVFLSNKAANSFLGYAEAQLDRIKNALNHDSMRQQEQEVFLQRSLERAFMDFERRYKSFDENNYIKMSIDTAINPELEKEIYLDVQLKHYPLRDYTDIYSEMKNIVKTHYKLNHRNKKKDTEHLCKHAMHLVRLYLMGIDIFTKHEIHTYRENDLDLLMSIRNGDFVINNDLDMPIFSDDFYRLVDSYKEKFKQAVSLSTLPAKPDYEKINSLSIKIMKDYWGINK